MIIQTGMRTDIPAFYSKWFLNRIKEGYVCVRNPYNPKQVTKYSLSPEVVDLIAFCTKNPLPMLPFLEELKPYGQYWFVTITPYGPATEDEQIGIFERYCKFLNSLDCNYKIIESDIIKQQRVRNKNNDFSTEISYAKRTEKKEIEEIMDDVRENDQCLFFVGVTIIFMAESKKELESVCETVETIGKRNSCTIDTHYLKQREALSTALPIGVRQVETMRTLLTQSLQWKAEF